MSWQGRRGKDGEKYVLNLNLYYDEVNADRTVNLKPGVILVSIYEKGSNDFVRDVILKLESSNKLVTYENPSCSRPDLLTSILEYKATIDIDSNSFNHPQGYYIVYEICCRNKIVNNIVEPQQTGMVFYFEFPSRKEIVRNSSPTFNPIRGEYFCAGVYQEYDFGAVDVNGDSLVYSLVEPWRGYDQNNDTDVRPKPANSSTGEYPAVTWVSGIGVNNMIPGNPSLSIDSQTGVIGVRASENDIDELFVIAVMVEEYRDGRKIGAVRREFQFKVVECDENYDPVVVFKRKEGPEFGDSDTLTVEFGNTECFQVQLSDSSVFLDDSEVINISTSGSLPSSVLDIQTSIFTLNLSRPVQSTEACLVNCKNLSLERDSVFDLQVIAKDDGCPVPFYDTTTVKVLLKGRVNQRPRAGLFPEVNTYNLLVGDTLVFEVYGIDSDTSDILSLDKFGNSGLANKLGFTSTTGKDSVSGRVYGTVGCAELTGNPHQLIFRVKDESCSPSKYDTTSVLVNVSDKETEITSIEPVNLITPNGDGKNDYFYLKDLPEGNCTYFFAGVEIFNRWGGLVYNSDDPEFRWFADNATPGIYYYKIDLNEEEVTGWLRVTEGNGEDIESGF